MMKRNLLLGLCVGLICTSGMVHAMDATVTIFHDSIKNKAGLDTPNTGVKATLLAAATKLKTGEEKDTTAAEARVLALTDDAGNTPLIMACEFGPLEVVKFLVDEKKADVKIANGLTGDTPLFVASEKGLLEVVKFLVTDKKADVNAAKAVSLVTPLHLSLKNPDPKVFEFFLANGANSAAKNSDGWIPLHTACSENRLDAVKTLVAKDKGLVNVLNNDKETPLFQACQSGSKDIVQLLIDNGANVKQKSFNQSTPLHKACLVGAYDVAEALLKGGADVNVVMDLLGTPLHRAIEKGHDNIVKLLLEHGADLTLKNAKGQTPIALPPLKGKADVIKKLLEKALTDKLEKNCKRSWQASRSPLARWPASTSEKSYLGCCLPRSFLVAGSV